MFWSWTHNNDFHYSIELTRSDWAMSLMTWLRIIYNATHLQLGEVGYWYLNGLVMADISYKLTNIFVVNTTINLNLSFRIYERIEAKFEVFSIKSKITVATIANTDFIILTSAFPWLYGLDRVCWDGFLMAGCPSYYQPLPVFKVNFPIYTFTHTCEYIHTHDIYTHMIKKTQIKCRFVSTRLIWTVWWV